MLFCVSLGLVCSVLTPVSKWARDRCHAMKCPQQVCLFSSPASCPSLPSIIRGRVFALYGVFFRLLCKCVNVCATFVQVAVLCVWVCLCGRVVLWMDVLVALGQTFVKRWWLVPNKSKVAPLLPSLSNGLVWIWIWIHWWIPVCGLERSRFFYKSFYFCHFIFIVIF